MWILSGKVIIALVWTFWLISSGSVANGNPADQAGFVKIVKPDTAQLTVQHTIE